MLKGKGTRFAGLLLAVLILLCSLPLPALASEYDPLYPEILRANDLSAASAILIEANTGNVIFEKNADAIMYPASTTKILTVWLAINMTKDNSNEAEGTGLYQKITVSENAVNLAADESSAKLAAGEEVRLIDLMYAAMLLSGNDAATAIAEGLSGSVEAFAYEMTTTTTPPPGIWRSWPRWPWRIPCSGISWAARPMSCPRTIFTAPAPSKTATAS